MKKSLLFTSLLAGLALAGCNKSTKSDTVATDYPAATPATTTTTADTAAARMENAARNTGNAIERAGERTANAMSNMAHDVSVKLTEWRLSAREIEADIAADRPIVRSRTNAGAPTGNTDKSALQSAVEAKIKADSELANLKLDINADRAGEIQLEGKALTADQVGKAIALALDTEGVSKVTSKIKLDKDAVKNR